MEAEIWRLKAFDFLFYTMSLLEANENTYYVDILCDTMEISCYFKLMVSLQSNEKFNVLTRTIYLDYNSKNVSIILHINLFNFANIHAI